MAGEALTPTSYIQHHLHNLTAPVGKGEGMFWHIHVDTFLTAVLMGLVIVVAFWLGTRKATAGVPGKWQAFVEICLEFVDRQAKDTYHGKSKLVTPIAITIFFWILLMNLLKMIPADFIAKPLEWAGVHYWKPVPTADVNATLGMAISVFFLMLFFALKSRAWAASSGIPDGAVRQVDDAVQPDPQHRRVAEQADLAGDATVRQHVRRRNRVPADLGAGWCRFLRCHCRWCVRPRLDAVPPAGDPAAGLHLHDAVDRVPEPVGRRSLSFKLQRVSTFIRFITLSNLSSWR